MTTMPLQGPQQTGWRRHHEWLCLARLLPNALTLGNLALGSAALGVALGGAVDARSAPLIVLSLLAGALACDLLDGRAARAFHSANAFGVELDSLADVVSFGLAPAAVLWSWKLDRAGALGLCGVAAIVLAAATRLARFNVTALLAPTDGAPATRSVGLPVTIPAAIALGAATSDLAVSPRAVAIGAVVLGALMVSRLGYRTFKRRSLVVIVLPALLAMGLGVLALGEPGPGIGLGLFALGTAYALSAPLSALRRAGQARSR